MSGEEVRLKMASDENFDIKSSYIVAQVAHTTCNKTIMKYYQTPFQRDSSEGYEKILSH
jgi:hypothetical protein